MKRAQKKRIYITPSSNSTSVAIEKALLVTTTRLLLEVDETQNINAKTTGSDEPGGEMYFEF
jgi:hypothetical protein